VFVVTKTHEADGDAALRLLQKNLKELQTGHADLVYAHSLGDMDLRTALSKNGVLAALQKAKRDGLCRFIGISGHSRPAKFVRALQDFDIDVMMCAVNFADRHTYKFEQNIFPIAARKNVGLVAMKVYGGADWRSQAQSNRMMPDEYLRQAFRYALSLPNVP
jgi:predicted aldo/keto reductase-like oxidoreductase